MFSVLQIKPQSRNLTEKLLFFKKSPTVKTERISLSGAAFNVITAYSQKGKVDFDAVYSAAGRTSKYLLKGENAFLPEDDSRFAFYEPKLLFEKMLFNTAIEILLRSGRAPQSISAVLVDKNAAFTNEIPSLIERAANVTVVTKKKAPYEKTAEKIMEEYGASIIIRDKLLSIKNVDMVISPSFNAPEHLKNVIIINNTAKRISPSFKPKDFDLPYPYDRYLPEGVDKRDFAGAAYEFCGALPLSKLCFRSLTLNSYEISLLSAAKTLDTNGGI